MAHHKAIGSVTEANPVLSKGDFEAVSAAIGRMIASVPESQTMAAYNAFLEFKDVVKAHPIAATAVETPAALSGKLGAIDAAAGKLSAAAYPLIKDVDWTSNLSLTPLPGASPNQVLKAIDKALVMGASMDGKLLQDAAMAHHKAIGGMDGKLVASLSDFEAINAALGKAIASVPTSQVMDVYNFFGKIVSPVVPNYLYSSVNPGDAAAAYGALLNFKDVVKKVGVAAFASEEAFDPIGLTDASSPKPSESEIKHGRQALLASIRPEAMRAALRRGGSVLIPATAAAAAAAPAHADEIGDAAKKLAEKAYPFMKEVNWNSTAYLLKPGSAGAGDWVKAVDKAIVMGASMDSKLLKAGVMAHHKAIGSVTEANPVLSKGDFEAVSAAIGRMIASVPESQTMDVYNAFAALVSSDVPPYLMSTVKEADAMAAYNALLEFKDVVKAHPIAATAVETPAALSGKLGAIDAAAGKLGAI